MAKQLPKQVETALLWVKGNTLIVTFCAIAVVVPVGAYFAQSALGEGVQKKAQERAELYSKVTAAKNETYSLPVPGGEAIALNGRPSAELLSNYELAMRGLEGDATKIAAAAREFNQGSSADPKHAPVVARKTFPAYAAGTSAADGVRFAMVDALGKAYSDLLADVRAGSPPQPAVVGEAVVAQEKRLIRSDFQADARSELKAEDLKKLDEKLSRYRIAQYADTAKGYAMYADISAFEVPGKPLVQRLRVKTKDERAAHDKLLFELQWKYWVVSDIMRAFALANADSASLLNAPLKRVLSVKVQPAEVAGGASQSSGEAASMGGDEAAAAEASAEVPAEGAVADAGATDAAAAPVAEPPLGEPAIDIAQAVNPEYSKRYTGRVSNGVYDVRLVDVVFVAETAKLPAIFDALARQNFMTVTNVRLAPADPFAAARDGYLYGAEPVSQVMATIETIWLREWTAQHMPAAVRTALGIADKAPEAATEAPAADSAQGM